MIDAMQHDGEQADLDLGVLPNREQTVESEEVEHDQQEADTWLEHTLFGTGESPMASRPAAPARSVSK